MRRRDVGAQLVLRHAFRKVWNAARNASMVMSLAFCISASSVALLIMRQPAVISFGVDELGRRRFLLDAAEDEEAQPLFDADAAAGGAAILEDAGDLPVGAFVFLPHAHFGGLRHQLARAFFFEAGAHPRELALAPESRTRTAAR